MKLDSDQYFKLAQLLNDKYNRDFWMDDEAWKKYLTSFGGARMDTNNPRIKTIFFQTLNDPVVVLVDPNDLDCVLAIPDEIALKALALGCFA